VRGHVSRRLDRVPVGYYADSGNSRGSDWVTGFNRRSSGPCGFSEAMKLTDQEQVILKAIGHVGRSGLAEILKVVRAVGYPKATTKKVLVKLSEKGIVSLHRHDWPQSLTPADRKLMVLSKGHYYNAVSVMKRNPKGKHLAGATAKQQRQYEHILESAKEYGRYGKRKKEVAARTVRKRQNKSGKGKQALKTTGRALKKVASSVLGAGSQILGAGSKALNPKRRVKAKKKRAGRHASRAIHSAKAPTKHRARASSIGHKVAKKISLRSVAKTRKASARRVTRNPSAESIRKKFAGRVSGERDVFVPGGTPKGKLAKLGNLVLIQTEKGTIKPIHGSAVLLADMRGKLHIGSLSSTPLFNGPRKSFGKVKRIEYEDSKPHLGFKSPIVWHHRMGEESGHRPTLHADGKGGLVFKGGRYRLTRRGIEN